MFNAPGKAGGNIARAPAPRAVSGGVASSPATNRGIRVNDAEADEIELGALPGAPNAVLRKKLWDTLYEPDEFLRRSRFLSLLALMRPEDAPAVEQIFYDADKEGRTYFSLFSSFWGQWGKLDGGKAMKQLQADHHLRHIDSLFTDVGRGWARTSAAEAKKWLEDHRNDANKWEAIQEGVWQGEIEKDPTGIVETLIKTLPAPEASRRIGDVAWNLINTRGVQAATQWLAQQSGRDDIPSGLMKTAVNAVAQATTRAGPQPLADFIESRPDSAELRQQVQRFVDVWVGDNAMSRLSYIAVLPENYYSPEAVNQALSAFDDAREPDALGLWLKEHKDARFYDDAALRYVRSLREVDPAAAKAWTETIKDPAKRAQALGN
jgi:hypothetical protein